MHQHGEDDGNAPFSIVTFKIVRSYAMSEMDKLPVCLGFFPPPLPSECEHTVCEYHLAARCCVWHDGAVYVFFFSPLPRYVPQSPANVISQIFFFLFLIFMVVHFFTGGRSSLGIVLVFVSGLPGGGLGSEGKGYFTKASLSLPQDKLRARFI